MRLYDDFPVFYWLLNLVKYFTNDQVSSHRSSCWQVNRLLIITPARVPSKHKPHGYNQGLFSLTTPLFAILPHRTGCNLHYHVYINTHVEEVKRKSICSFLAGSGGTLPLPFFTQATIAYGGGYSLGHIPLEMPLRDKSFEVGIKRYRLGLDLLSTSHVRLYARWLMTRRVSTYRIE